MKQLLLIITFILGTISMSSCSNQPDNAVHATKTEAAGWIVDKSVSENPIQKFDEYYQISPTWGQSISYAAKTDDFPVAVALGVVFIVGAVVLLMLKSKDSKLISESVDKVVIYIAFVLLVAGLYAVYSKPGEIKWNNDKWVKKEIYDKTIKETGSTQPIWDSLEVNNLIIGK